MEEILRVEDLSLHYGAGQVKALDQVSFQLPKGCRAALVGPNGAGKSSLFKALLGLEKGASGKVSLLGQSEKLDQVIQKNVAYIPQASQVNWQFPARVLDIVLMGRFAHTSGFFRRPSSLDKEKAEQALEEMKISDLRNRQIDQLSGGQRQRVFLARALAQEAELYMMDEPLAGIDQVTEQVIMDCLKKFQQEGKTSLVIHHDLLTLEKYFDYVLWLNGRLVAEGPMNQVDLLQAYQAAFGQEPALFLKEGLGHV
ncbi:metal ABC transporter ATP-binding protein [Streptococcus suis]|uniref:metal ABC transporter ATP-binding protein n=1 Tax=Streptococcus suis TaxID=1307 RepID=UPI00211CF17D|nr:metal ABC transporter ATP-binding protein [Streptococcus suis]UUM57287.1 metal ABC transporter ATP-binding protein [Streptococcus suis]UUM62939.1 metal ABC transporter ATP-binding protein [Streptococcus suis]